jgi:transposase InsO family protein
MVGAFFAAFRPRASLVAENLLLRRQLAILCRATPRPRLRPIDHAFWVTVSRLWSRWVDTLAIVRPATVIEWHRRGFARIFFVLSLERRRVLHVNVTAHPHAAWAAQQIVEAIGADFLPAYLIRDRDGIYGAAFDAHVDHLGIEQVKIAPRSPWQNGYAERWVGTLRRELLDQ